MAAAGHLQIQSLITSRSANNAWRTDPLHTSEFRPTYRFCHLKRCHCRDNTIKLLCRDDVAQLEHGTRSSDDGPFRADAIHAPTNKKSPHMGGPARCHSTNDVLPLLRVPSWLIQPPPISNMTVSSSSSSARTASHEDRTRRSARRADAPARRPTASRRRSNDAEITLFKSVGLAI